MAKAMTMCKTISTDQSKATQSKEWKGAVRNCKGTQEKRKGAARKYKGLHNQLQRNVQKCNEMPDHATMYKNYMGVQWKCKGKQDAKGIEETPGM